MATLDTALLIQPAVAPASTPAQPSKSTESFERFLDDETRRVGQPEPQPKHSAAESRPVREAYPPSVRRSSYSKTQPGRDLSEVHSAARPQVGSAKTGAAASEAQANTTGRDSQDETIVGSSEVAAESAQRQDLPSDTAAVVSKDATLATEESVMKTVEIEMPVQTTLINPPAVLLASLLVQTTADLKGIQVDAERGLEVVGSLVPEPQPAVTQRATPSRDTRAVLTLAMPIPAQVDGQPTADASQSAATDLTATIRQEASEALPETMASVVLAKDWANEPVMPQIEAAESESALVTGWEGAPAEPVPQGGVSMGISHANPPESAGRPLETQLSPAVETNDREVTVKEEQPKLDLRADPSEPQSQPGAQTGARDRQDADPSHSEGQEARKDSAEIVHKLKPTVSHKEASQVRPLVDSQFHTQQAQVTPDAAEPVPSRGLHTSVNPLRNAALSTITATENSPALSMPDLPPPAGMAEVTSKPSISQPAVAWSQAEKAQVISQIVERAHLLGKNQNELVVVLKPEFLGKVNLHAAMVDNRLVATIMAESATVKQMLEGQLSSLQMAMHDQGLPVARVEVVQGNQLSFADLGTGQSSSHQHLESGKSHLPPSLSRYESDEDEADVSREAPIYAPLTSRSLNLVA